MIKDKEPSNFDNTKEKIPDYDHLFNEGVDKKGKRKSFFLRSLLKSNIGGIISSTFVYLLQSSPTFVTPIITANIIDIVDNAIKSSEGVTTDVWIRLAINAAILFVFILQNIPSTMWRWNIVSKMLRRTITGIRCSVVRKLQCLSLTYFKNMETGKIQSKFLKDTATVESLLSCFAFTVLPNIIGVIVATVISVVKNGIISLFFLLIIPLNVGVSYAFRKKIRNRNHDLRVETEKMSSNISTMIEMLPVTKSHGLERTELKSAEQYIVSVEKSGLKTDKTLASFGAGMWVVSSLLSAVCFVFCSILALNKIISIGDVVLYQSLFTSISGYVLGIINSIPTISSGLEAIDSISEIMNVKDVEWNSGKFKTKRIDGRVSFENVSYKFPDGDQYVVKDLNFDIDSGECVAFVGASGSGKSTIMNLIIGFLSPDQGRVLVDGKPLTEYDLSEYRHHISVVPQTSILFGGTVRENITYGIEDYSEADLEKAIEMANLKEFIDSLPNGVDTVIGEHGDKLSGGQRQRISIARAIIRNPSILIFDEATSALDNISEYQVQKALSTTIKGRTTFIVAHRLSTIRDADRIMVMDNGRCVESGTYKELIEKKGKFYELKTLSEMS